MNKGQSTIPPGSVLSLCVARMVVPKMVNNGFNSVLGFSCQLGMDGSSKEIKDKHEAKSCPQIPKRE